MQVASMGAEDILRHLVAQAYARGLATSEVMAECHVDYPYAQEVRQRMQRRARSRSR